MSCEFLQRLLANNFGDDSLKGHISLLLTAGHALHDSVQQTRFQDETDIANILICDAYISLFDDITTHKDVWLEKLLHPSGYPAVGHVTAHCLSYMARAHDMRNEHSKCKAVLKLETLTLTCFEKQIQHAPGPLKEALEGAYHPLLEHHHLNHHRVYCETLSPEFVPSYRWLLENEVTGGPNGTSRHFFRELMPGVPQDIKIIEALNETTKGKTDAEVVAFHKKARKAMGKDVCDVKLCTWCQKSETKFGKWKTCGRCKGPVYCSEECQRVDWKRQHRMMCKP